MLYTYTYESCSIVVYLFDETLLIEFSSLDDNDLMARCELMGWIFY